MNPTSANLRSRLGDACRCDVTSEGPQPSWAALSPPLFFFPGGKSGASALVRRGASFAAKEQEQLNDSWLTPSSGGRQGSLGGASLLERAGGKAPPTPGVQGSLGGWLTCPQSRLSRSSRVTDVPDNTFLVLLVPLEKHPAPPSLQQPCPGSPQTPGTCLCPDRPPDLPADPSAPESVLMWGAVLHPHSRENPTHLSPPPPPRSLSPLPSALCPQAPDTAASVLLLTTGAFPFGASMTLRDQRAKGQWPGCTGSGGSR